MIGSPLAGIETPALVVDLDAFDHNVHAMALACRTAGIALRPHGKAHKSPAIAHRQIEAGAVGVCCQTVAEAEAFVAAGIDDVLLTNQIVDEGKATRLAALAERAHVGLCVDSREGIALAAQAAQRRGVTLRVLVEIDVGQHRCGVRPGTEAVALAAEVVATDGLRLDGLQAYHGAAQHLRAPAERAEAIAGAAAAAQQTVDAIRAAGLDCPVVSGGGTGSFPLEARFGTYTEIQAGSYVLMDADYARNETDNDAVVLRQALHVHARVISVAFPGRAVLDAGLKTVAVDSGLPVLADAQARVLGLADEHCVIEQPAGRPLELGQIVRLVAGHVDPTTSLHDRYLVARDGVVVDVWPIVARGAGR